MSPAPKKRAKKTKVHKGKADHKAPFKYRGTKGGDAYHAQLNFIQQQAHNNQVNELIKQLNTANEYAKRSRDDTINEIFGGYGPMEVDARAVVPPTRPDVHMPDVPVTHRDIGTSTRPASTATATTRTRALERVVMEAPPAVADSILQQAGTNRAEVVRGGSLRARFGTNDAPRATPSQAAAARRPPTNGYRFGDMLAALTEASDIHHPPQFLAGLRRHGSEIPEDIGDNKAAKYNQGDFESNLRPYGSADQDDQTRLRRRVN